jgi:formate hydrogenlyase subunit 3/multisubunit Na+/H+ antiporter MnhD subunit
MSVLLVLALLVPITGALLGFVVGGRWAMRIALATMPLGLAIAVAIAAELRPAGGSVVYHLGGWNPPLGIALRADWLSAVMMVTTSVVIAAIAVFAGPDFASGSSETRRPFAWWILLLAVWAALNTVFLSGDLFTFYVSLELLVFVAVPLVALDGRAETLQAALRYLLFALLGSVFYLAGTGLLYGAYGTLDIGLLAGRARAEPVTAVALTLMTVGLMAKTALFPLYLWLPAAHAGAPAAASAVLSALVVKGSFFIVIRLWFFALPGLTGIAAPQLLGAAGAGAIVFGSLLALRQERLKLLVAYSTVAQLGYLFLVLPLALDVHAGRLVDGGALVAGLVQAASHASAKAAMFMAAGMIYVALGHDRIAGLGGVVRAAPIAALVFVLAGLALIGPPMSGVYLAKTLYLRAADSTHQWWWSIVLQLGGVLTGAYLVMVIAHALAPADKGAASHVGTIPRRQQAAALALVMASLLLGLLPWHAWLPLPPVIMESGTLSFGALWSLVWPLVTGAAVAVVLGRRESRKVLRLGSWIEQADDALRQWPVASIAFLGVAAVLGIAILMGQ